jgi:hypothetical protein
MYKCLAYPNIKISLCVVAGVSIVCILLISALLLTNGMNEFYYDIGELDLSVKDLNNTIKRKNAEK